MHIYIFSQYTQHTQVFLGWNLFFPWLYVPYSLIFNALRILCLGYGNITHTVGLIHKLTRKEKTLMKKNFGFGNSAQSQIPC